MLSNRKRINCTTVIHVKIEAGGNYVGGATMGEGAGALAHQPNSLDDLDGETLPFDDVPIRYDASGKRAVFDQESCS